jgi:membrane protein involved in colicin uptake
MKQLFALSMLISFAMICSCQKQHSAAEQQLAQRKTELDAREKALDEREKALAEREKATADIRRIPADVQRRAPADVQRRIPDAAQLKAEKERRMQQLPPEVQMLMPDSARVQAYTAEKELRKQERSAQRQLRLGGLQRESQPNPDKAQTSGAAASPAEELTSPTASPTPQ